MPTAALGMEMSGLDYIGAIVAGDEVGLSCLQARYDEQLRGVSGRAVVAQR